MVTRKFERRWLLLLGSVTGCAVSGATPGSMDDGAFSAGEDGDAGSDVAGPDEPVEMDGDSVGSPIEDDPGNMPEPDDGGATPSTPDAGLALDAGAPSPPPLPPSTCQEDAGVATPTDIGLFVKYKSGGGAPEDQEIKPHLVLENRGSEAISLSEVTVTYWFTREGTDRRIVFECDYAALGCSSLVATSGDACGVGVDTFVRITFTAGQLAPGASTGEMQLRLHKDDYSAFDETNDYSFAAVATTFAEYAHITLTRGDELVWGDLPY